MNSSQKPATEIHYSMEKFNKYKTAEGSNESHVLKMEDADLEAIRAKRLAQLRSQYGDGGGENRNQAAEERENQANEIRNNILSQILDQSARARLNTLMIGKPEKGKMVENMLLQMAQTGRLAGKISESELIRLLEDINKQTSKTTTVKFDRRRAALDDSDDEL